MVKIYATLNIYLKAKITNIFYEVLQNAILGNNYVPL